MAVKEGLIRDVPLSGVSHESSNPPKRVTWRPIDDYAKDDGPEVV